MKLVRKLLAAALCVAAAPTVFAQEITLKVHHFWPPGAMPPSTLLVPWCDKIAKDSNNRLKCQIYPAMQLGGTPPQLIDQVKDGVADIVWTLPGYTAGRFPVMEVFELPFMSASAEATSPGRVGVLRDARQQGVPGHQGDRRQRARQRLRARQRQAGQDARRLQGHEDARADAADQQDARALGATPVAMPLPALADALSKGVVDGYLLPWEVIPSIKAHELIEVPQRDRSEVARAVHRGVHPRHEPGEVRQPAARPEEGDRRQLGRRRWRARSASSGTPRRRRRASRPPTAATRST